MGLFSWLTGDPQRRGCIKLIERYLEVARKHGLWDGDARQCASELTEFAYAQLPPLKNGPYRGALLAACVMGVAAGEPNVQGTRVGLLYGKALCAMVDMALREVGGMTYAQVSMLEKLEKVAIEFRGHVPVEADAIAQNSDEVDLASLMSGVNSLPTREERMAAMTEVMRRMRRAAGYPQ